MKYIYKNIFSIMFLIILSIAVAGCALTIDMYDENAYQNATSAKVDSLALMDKAIEPYASHENSIEALKVTIDKSYEYANGLPKNKEVAEQWRIMKDPSGNLIGGFLVYWKKKVQLSAGFIGEAKKNISLGFDQIIELEAKKIKDSE